MVTGTNGKTTTTGMLESILRAAGLTRHRPAATSAGRCWRRCWPAPADAHRQDVIAVELSSFQLHWAPGIRPAAGVVLNVAEDHLDWHGSMAAYAAAKARALTGEVALAVVDDPGAAGLLAAAPAPAWSVPIRSGGRPPGRWACVDGMLVDRRVRRRASCWPRADEVRPPGAHNVTNALAAAGLALAVGVAPARGGRRAARVPARAGTATCWSPSGPACGTSTTPRPPTRTPRWPRCWPTRGWCGSPAGSSRARRSTTWCAAVRDRLAGVVLLGVDAPMIDAALSRHAPDVPVLVVPGQGR